MTDTDLKSPIPIRPGSPHGRAGTTSPVDDIRGRRLVFVLNDLTLGGAERQALLLARTLQSSFGANVRVCALEGPTGRVAEICREYNIPCEHFHIRFAYRRHAILKAMASLTFHLRRLQPDLLLPYITRPNVLCGCIWPFTGAGGCVWNQRDAGLTRFGSRLEQLAVRRASHFVSNSQHAAEFLTTGLSVSPRRISVIPNGIEISPSNPPLEAPVDLPALEAGDFLACMVASISEFKDHSTLIRAWRVVTDRWDRPGRPILLLAGKPGAPYEGLRKLTADLHLETHVRFLGAVEDVGALLRRIDLCVFSSLSEGCPNGILEAMATGLPVAATDIPGIREAVGPTGRPFLAPPGNAELLALRVLELAGDRALARALGQHNRCRVSDEFSLQALGQKSAELFVRVLNGRLAPACD